jgi:hypothetical protein
VARKWKIFEQEGDYKVEEKKEKYIIKGKMRKKIR